MAKSIGLIKVETADEVTTRETKEKQELENMVRETQNKPLVSALVSHIRSAFTAAEQARQTVERRMEKNIRQRDGVYEADKLAEIRQVGGSEIFMLLTDEKCTAAKSWLQDTTLPASGRPWSIAPTPLPELPPLDIDLINKRVQAEVEAAIKNGLFPTAEEIQQRLEKLASDVQIAVTKMAKMYNQRMELKIDDLLTEGDWGTALRAVLDDVIDLPAGILKGPIVRKKPELSWEEDDETGEVKPVVRDRINIEWERISPFCIYPAPSSTDIDDGFLIEKHKLTRQTLTQMIGVEGFDDDAIKMVLDLYPAGDYTFTTSLKSTSTTSPEQAVYGDSNVHDPEGKIEALQYWGSLPGSMLVEYGIDIEDEYKTYQVEVWLIDDIVIKAELNGDPLGRKPYYKASFRERNGYFWGDGLPDTIADIQDMVNASARNLVNNMAMSSGPQIGVDLSRLAEGEDITSFSPWKIWQFDESAAVTSGGRQPLWFFQPKALIAELIRVYEFFSNEADNKTGIPKYSYGQGGSKSALGTATGMSMMMSNASRGIKKVVSNVDKMIEKSVQRTHNWIMTWGNDPDLKGDLKIVAKGSSTLLAKEQQQVRRNEFLSILTNPLIANIVGEEGIAKVLREIVSGLEMDDDIIPSDDEIRQRIMMQQQAMAMQQQMQKPPAGAAPSEKGPQTMPDGAVAGGGDTNAFQQ